jgi:hypothetical protein
MSVESIRFNNQIKQVRLAFAKTDCQPTDVLLGKYSLTTAFLEQLCNVGLLSPSKAVYCKGSRWINERAMALSKFTAIASKVPATKSPPAPADPKQNPEAPHDTPVATPFLGQVLKSRRSLTMGLKFTKGKELSGVLSWYSSHPSGVISSVNNAGRNRYYEQEVFELEGKIYRIVDLEDHLLKAIKEFFEQSVKLTIQRIHHE